MSTKHTSPQSSQLSPTSSTPLPGWAPPRAPLPPHRLAKLANALGVSTPSPAFRTSSLNTDSSASSSASSLYDHPLRSQTPSTTSSHNISSYAPATSKFLLHVIPPMNLPHDLDSSDYNLTPPPSTASGYHTQFRRGTVVPLYSTFQAQLGAIAKEYALPSTTGIVLYLVSGGASPNMRSSPTPLMDDGEPGPRLSEDIWKYLWTRVLRAERDDNISIASRSHTPNSFGLGIGLTTHPSSYSLHDPQGPLRPLVSSGRPETPQPQPLSYPFTPSPSTPSSSSDLRSKSAPLSSSQSEPETPDTSASSQFSEHGINPQVEALDLPGLQSQSIIPILAKVEFDIDKRRAAWYEPWIRSRRMNQAKRAESRSSNSMRAESQDDNGEGGTVDNGGKRPPLSLALVDGTGYEPLADANSGGIVEGEHDEDVTARILDTPGATTSNNPNIVNLALDAAELSTFPDDKRLIEDDQVLDEEDEVQELMDKLGRPHLSITIPPSPAGNGKRRSSPTTAGTIKRHIPPPLVLPQMPTSTTSNLPITADGGSPMPPGSSGSTRLAYLRDGSTPSTVSDETHGMDKLLPEDPHLRTDIRARSPVEEKRVGWVFDDIDLGLGEYDENDPFDRRKSQYLMKARLDEIERNLQEFSPRKLKNDLSQEKFSDQSTASSSPQHVDHGAVFPPTPRLPVEGSSWPAVPFSALNGQEGLQIPQTNNQDTTPSPPQLALNGVTTSAPKAFLQSSRPSSDVVSVETEYRKRELADQASPYPAATPTSSTHKTNSPVVPLSPDPFGRFPSSGSEVSNTSKSQTSPYWNATPLGLASSQLSNDATSRTRSSSAEQQQQQPRISATPSSRFSTDSVPADETGSKNPKGASLISVKSIKKIWRKSNKNSVSGSSGGPGAGRSSPQLTPPMPAAMQGGGLVVPPMPRVSMSSVAAPPPPPPAKHKRVDSALDHFHFDQESPYPVRRSPTPGPSPPLRPSISMQQSFSARPPSPPPVTTPVERSSMRKSILKSWKSASGNLSQSSSSGSDPSRPSMERNNETARPRKGSVLETPGSKQMRGSITSGSYDIPPNPQIPEEFINAQLQSLRPQSTRRQSGKPRPKKSSSTDSSNLSSPPTKPTLLGSASPPRSLMSVASSRESGETRGSFDGSQFEIVTAPQSNSVLSYPYHGLDHD